ncbi:VWA domain-containing protein [Leucobacter sp. GX0328]
MQTMEAGDIDVRAGLRAVGGLLGLPVIVTDGAEWRLTRRGLEVGLLWYGARGHGSAEAMALAALQLWEGPRERLVAADRARRRDSFERRAPHEAPLTRAIARMQAVGELLAAFPGFRSRLGAALERGLPRDPSVLPRHLQWVVLLLAAEQPATELPVDRAVLAEWRRMHRRSGSEALLRHVFAPDGSRPPLLRFERAYALLQPAYARLLAIDAREAQGPVAGGAPDGGDDAEDDGRDEAGAGDTGSSAAGDDRDAPDETPPADETDGGAPDAGADERARPGDGGEIAEGADLFAAEQAGFVGTVLATPLPADGAMLEAMLDRATEATGEAANDRPGGRGTAGAAPVSPIDYRERATELAPAIDRMRALWARVIAERIAQRRAPSRDARTAGEDLADDALAAAVAEAHAGVPQPRAFRARVLRSRRTRRAGSTDYLLLVDRSASMQGRAAEAAADAMLVLVESLAGVDRDIAHAERAGGVDLDLDIRTGLVVFDGDAHLVKPLSHGIDDATRRDLQAAVRSPRGSTNDGAALRLAADQFGIGAQAGSGPASRDGLERRRIAILVSDGGSNDLAAAEREVQRLRAAGVSVHGIGVGGDEIAVRYAPTGRTILDPRELARALEAIVEDELP